MTSEGLDDITVHGSLLDVMEFVQHTILPRLLETGAIDDEDSLLLLLRLIDLIIPALDSQGIHHTTSHHYTTPHCHSHYIRQHSREGRPLWLDDIRVNVSMGITDIALHPIG